MRRRSPTNAPRPGRQTLVAFGLAVGLSAIAATGPRAWALPPAGAAGAESAGPAGAPAASAVPVLPARAYFLRVQGRGGVLRASWAAALTEQEQGRLLVHGGGGPGETVALPDLMGRYEHQRSVLVVGDEPLRAGLVATLLRRWTRRGAAAVPPYPYAVADTKDRLFGRAMDAEVAPERVVPVAVDLGGEACGARGAVRADLCGRAIAEPASTDDRTRYAVVAYGLSSVRDAAARSELVEALSSWSQTHADAVVYLLVSPSLALDVPATWTVAAVRPPEAEAIVAAVSAGELGLPGPAARSLSRSLRRNGALLDAARNLRVLGLLLRAAERGRTPARLTELAALVHEEVVRLLAARTGESAAVVAGRLTPRLERVAAERYPLACAERGPGRWTATRSALAEALGGDGESAAAMFETPALQGLLFTRVQLGASAGEDAFRFAVVPYQEYLAATRRLTPAELVRHGQDPTWRELLALHCGRFGADEAPSALALLDRLTDARERGGGAVQEDLFGGLLLAQGRCVGELSPATLGGDGRLTPELRSRALGLVKTLATAKRPVAGWDLYAAHPDVNAEWEDALRRSARLTEALERSRLTREVLDAWAAPDFSTTGERDRGKDLRYLAALGPTLEEAALEHAWEVLWPAAQPEQEPEAAFRAMTLETLASLPAPTSYGGVQRSALVETLRRRNEEAEWDREARAAYELFLSLCEQDVEVCLGSHGLAGEGMEHAGWRAVEGTHRTRFAQALSRHVARNADVERRLVSFLRGAGVEEQCRRNLGADAAVAAMVPLCRQYEVARVLVTLGLGTVASDRPASESLRGYLAATAEEAAANPGGDPVGLVSPTASCVAIANGARSRVYWQELRRGLAAADPDWRDLAYEKLTLLPCDRSDLADLHRAAVRQPTSTTRSAPGSAGGAADPVGKLLLGTPDRTEGAPGLRVSLEALTRVLAAHGAGVESAPLRPALMLPWVPATRRPLFVALLAHWPGAWDEPFEQHLWRCASGAPGTSGAERTACREALWWRYGEGGGPETETAAEQRERLRRALFSSALSDEASEAQRREAIGLAVDAVDWTAGRTDDESRFVRELVALLREPGGTNAGLLGRALGALWPAGRRWGFYIEEAPSWHVADALCPERAWLPPSDDPGELEAELARQLEANRPRRAIEGAETLLARLEAGAFVLPEEERRQRQRRVRLRLGQAHASLAEKQRAAGLLAEADEHRAAAREVLGGLIGELEREPEPSQLLRLALFLRGSAALQGQASDPWAARDDFGRLATLSDGGWYPLLLDAMALVDMGRLCRDAAVPDERCMQSPAAYHAAAAARCEEAQARWREAEGHGEGAPFAPPFAPNVHLYVVWSAALANQDPARVDEAVALVTRVLETLADDARDARAALLAHRGVLAYEYRFDTRAAVADMKAAVKLRPDDRSYRMNLMEAAFADGGYDETLETCGYLELRMTLSPQDRAVVHLFRLLALLGASDRDGSIPGEAIRQAAEVVYGERGSYPSGADRTWSFRGTLRALERLVARSLAPAWATHALDLVRGYDEQDAAVGRRRVGAALRKLVDYAAPYQLDIRFGWRPSATVAARALDTFARSLGLDRAFAPEHELRPWPAEQVIFGWDELRPRFELVRAGGDAAFPTSSIESHAACVRRGAEHDEPLLVETRIESDRIVLLWADPAKEEALAARYRCSLGLTIFGTREQELEQAFEFTVSSVPLRVRAGRWATKASPFVVPPLAMLAFLLGGYRASRARSERRVRRAFLASETNPYRDRSHYPVEAEADLVGRKDEFRALDGFLGADKGGWALLIGRSRIGKTSLLMTLAHGVVERRETDAHRPLAVYVNIGRYRPDRILAIVGARIRDRLLEEELVLPAVADDLFLTDAAPESYGGLELEEDIPVLLDAAEERLGKSLRLVLLLDEGDVLDAAQLAVGLALRTLVEELESRRIWVVSTLLKPPSDASRPLTDREDSPWWGPATRIFVSPLSREAVGKVLRDVVDGRLTFDADAVGAIQAHTEGVPQHVLFFGDFLLERARAQGRWRVRAGDVAAVEAQVRNYIRREESRRTGRGRVAALLSEVDRVYRSMHTDQRTTVHDEEIVRLRAALESIEEPHDTSDVRQESGERESVHRS